MLPTNLILDAVRDLLAADATTLAPATLGLHVHLAIPPFSPGAGALIGDMTEASFAGSAALVAGPGACQTFIDPVSGQRILQLNEPAGGWHWPCTATPAAPETIPGFYVTDNGDTVLYGAELFPVPIVINVVGQAVDVPYIRFRFLPTSPF